MILLSNIQPYTSGAYEPVSTGKIDLVVLREAKGEYVDRRYVPGMVEPITIKGVNIHPMSDGQKMVLPEADRSKEWLKIYSPVELFYETEGENRRGPDRFEYFGVMYEVMKSRVYRMGRLDHCKAMAVILEKTPE